MQRFFIVSKLALWLPFSITADIAFCFSVCAFDNLVIYIVFEAVSEERMRLCNRKTMFRETDLINLVDFLLFLTRECTFVTSWAKLFKASLA